MPLPLRRTPVHWLVVILLPIVILLFVAASSPIRADDAAQERLETWKTFDGSHGRLSSEPWISKSWKGAPFAIAPDDDTVSMSTSLRQLGRYSDQRDAKKIEEAKRLAPEGLKLPKAPIDNGPRFDLWSTLSADNALPHETSKLDGASGLEVKTRTNSIYGLAVSKNAAGGIGGDPQFALSPYLALKPTRNLNLSAKANVGEETYEANGQTISALQRSLTTGASTNWQFGDFKLSPAASMTYGETMQSDGQALSSTDVKLTPKVSRPIDLGGDQKLDPYVLYERELDIDPIGETEKSEAVGAGFTFGKTGAYELGVSSRIEHGDPAKDPDVEGKVQLKVPLP